MNWLDCLQTFEIIAKTHSFVAVARLQAIPNSVVTKRIQWLENELNCTLLIRTTRKVTLTDAGLHLLTKIKPLLNEWRDIHRQFVDYHEQPQGELTVCLPPNLITIPFFMHAFNQFLHKYPHVNLNIITTHSPIRLSDANVDLLIATEQYVLDPGTTVGISLFSLDFQCYAAPCYLARHGTPKKPSDLDKHNCLIYRNDNQWKFAKKMVTVAGSLRADTGEVLIATAIAGGGIIYIPTLIAQHFIQQNQLIVILNDYAARKELLKLFYLKHEYMPRKLEVFNNLLKNLLKNE